MDEIQSLETIHSFLENSARRFPDKIAVSFGDESLNYKELDEACNKVRDFLISKTQKGDRVAILIDNSIEFIINYFGVLKSGCVCVILGTNISDKNMAYEIEDSEPKILFYSDKFQGKLERLDSLQNIHKVNVDKDGLENVADVGFREVRKEDVSTIIYTSGTTSNPKGVKLQHDNVVNASKNIVEFIKNEEGDIYLSILPLSHSFGLGNIHVSFLMGGSVTIERNAINVKKILQRIIDENITFTAATPATLKIMTENYWELLQKCGKKLRIIISNTSAIPVEVTKKLIQLEKTNFCYYYGLTEASRSTFINFKKNPERLESVGRAAPNTKVEIREGNNKLSTKEVGEIWVYGKHVIKEYWNCEESSRKIVDGWFKTGDTGYLDDEGFLFIKGREDDVINVSGDKVAPEEVEDLTNKIEGVRESAAVGVDDPLLNQVVKLFVVPETSLEEQELKRRIVLELGKKLENFKIPREIEVVKEIPRTEMGKIKRSLLKMKKRDGSLLDFADQRMINLIGKTIFPGAVFVGRNGKNFLGSIKDKNVVIVASPSVLKNNLNKIEGMFARNKFEFIEYSGEPTKEDQEKISSKILKLKPDFVVGIGGGSVMDIVKSVKAEFDMRLVLIPTTIGTGSEATQYSLLKGKNDKSVVQSPHSLPDVVILDSDFLMSLPEEEIFFSSIDALAHSLEGLASKASNVLSDSIAIRSIDLIFKNLVSACKGKDKKSLDELQIAGFLSGIVQGTASVGIIHSLAHQFGPRFDILHSRAVGMWLIEGLKMNVANCEVYNKLDDCKHVGRENLIEKCSRLFVECGFDNSKAIEKARGVMVEQISEDILRDVCTKTNPFMPKKEDVEGLIREVLS